MHLKLEFRPKDISLRFIIRDMSFHADMDIKNEEFRLEFKNYQGIKNADVYDGAYTVTPKDISQQLKTKNKLMNKDVMVKRIPFFETSNEEGGNTVYIGKEL
ncbi:hypothetical protein CATMIT_02138 [Catenibacterium mitsuokai DSM 15897]|uniref:hypothetical protein n=1 Tax=Catenibacterium mitsuokai TaxID=100886 RepID=UPI000196CAE1|nr:hypothetical protein [Catenibacterium mitsuokai]EEF93187.1 hypothetical protein CATMIT_02138 [Catenibacterium mitsuokai DSM 15897]UWO52004.1 hypothetical protein NQ499_06870 [Catenibacterium mitsuokai]